MQRIGVDNRYAGNLYTPNNSDRNVYFITFISDKGLTAGLQVLKNQVL